MCDYTPGGHVETTGFGSACAPRSEDSGMAGPKRPFRAATAGGERALTQHNGSASMRAQRSSTWEILSWCKQGN